MKRHYKLIVVFTSVIFLLSGGKAIAQPFADFVWNPSIPIVNQTVDFTNQSFGTIVSSYWDFGGGCTPNYSTLQDPTVIFDSAGNYVVSLTVYDNFGDSSTNALMIIVFDSGTTNSNYFYTYIIASNPNCSNNGSLTANIYGGIQPVYFY
ncbi:hypothetical protein LBMAG27_02460 [Bacteroidota bacterium]|nr:hypothetical protein LBMAG27_02460 [Bacteroidota bacterium]